MKPDFHDVPFISLNTYNQIIYLEFNTKIIKNNND